MDNPLYRIVDHTDILFDDIKLNELKDQKIVVSMTKEYLNGIAQNNILGDIQILDNNGKIIRQTKLSPIDNGDIVSTPLQHETTEFTNGFKLLMVEMYRKIFEEIIFRYKVNEKNVIGTKLDLNSPQFYYSEFIRFPVNLKNKNDTSKDIDDLEQRKINEDYANKLIGVKKLNTFDKFVFGTNYIIEIEKILTPIYTFLEKYDIPINLFEIKFNKIYGKTLPYSGQFKRILGYIPNKLIHNNVFLNEIKNGEILKPDHFLNKLKLPIFSMTFDNKLEDTIININNKYPDSKLYNGVYKKIFLLLFHLLLIDTNVVFNDFTLNYLIPKVNINVPGGPTNVSLNNKYFLDPDNTEKYNGEILNEVYTSNSLTILPDYLSKQITQSFKVDKELFIEGLLKLSQKVYTNIHSLQLQLICKLMNFNEYYVKMENFNKFFTKKNFEYLPDDIIFKDQYIPPTLTNNSNTTYDNKTTYIETNKKFWYSPNTKYFTINTNNTKLKTDLREFMLFFSENFLVKYDISFNEIDSNTRFSNNTDLTTKLATRNISVFIEKLTTKQKFIDEIQDGSIIDMNNSIYQINQKIISSPGLHNMISKCMNEIKVEENTNKYLPYNTAYLNIIKLSVFLFLFCSNYEYYIGDIIGLADTTNEIEKKSIDMLKQIEYKPVNNGGDRMINNIRNYKNNGYTMNNFVNLNKYGKNSNRNITRKRYNFVSEK